MARTNWMTGSPRERAAQKRAAQSAYARRVVHDFERPRPAPAGKQPPLARRKPNGGASR